MSTLAKTYALQVGVKLSEPEIQESYFPLEHPIDKVILVHGFGGAIITDQNGAKRAVFPAKVYDYFTDVVHMLKPIVEPLGYKLYQIGAPDEPPIHGLESLVGKTSLLQCTFLVKRCALLIGNDSIWAHQRGAFRGSEVIVYGPTSKPHFPHWNEPSKTRLIESHRNGKKPSFQSNEFPKTVNLIPPEQVVDNSLDLLGIKNPNKRQSLMIGVAYNMPAVELIPDAVIDPRITLPVVPIIRMDVLFNEDNMLKNLRYRKCSVITNKEINLELLKSVRPNVEGIRIEIDKISTEWIKNAKKLGVKIAVVATEKDDEKVKQMRLHYYDATQPSGFDRFLPPTLDDFKKEVVKYTQKPLDESIKLDKLLFRTNKFILSDGKVFLSKAHLKAGISTPSSDKNIGTVIDSPDFWEEQAHFYIYNES